MSGKNSIKTKTKTFLLFEKQSNNIIMPCQKKKALTEYLKLNVKVLNTLNRAKYEYLGTYILRDRERKKVDCGVSAKMIEIREKAEKSNT